ncbi:hypothetical protein HZH66_007375 [Vespula vulgaris]|uniref:Uncharacterized protein n=2 Tax=Vespula TaxID=7451 RepID=A0A834U9F4_VESPE|nr:hypothetical protein HZH66_007375 [Vespula vulgaris]KAF7423529.1 hypothetical protein H0235_008812 [Vespula pensylvanica]
MRSAFTKCHLNSVNAEVEDDFNRIETCETEQQHPYSQEIKTQFDVLPSSSWKENYRNYEVSRNPGRIEEEQKEEEQQCRDKGAYVGEVDVSLESDVTSIGKYQEWTNVH